MPVLAPEYQGFMGPLQGLPGATGYNLWRPLRTIEWVWVGRNL